MRILLLQDEIYIPSLGGGTKANRYLFEDLARRGHQCRAITRALTRSPDGPNSREEFSREMAARNIPVEVLQTDVFEYQHEGVRVQAGVWSSTHQAKDHVSRTIDAFAPDWVLVADDKRRFMLESAVQSAPDRVILIVQTIIQLPFGPLSVGHCPRQTELMSRSRSLVVISRYLERYVREHSRLACRLLRLPVYGEGPFPNLACFDAGYVTMINPCELKGVAIFLALAREFPNVQFAAVPTWGADAKVLDKLNSLPNVSLLEPADDIETILAQTRVLLVPSLWPETFGYVVPEAMLRGIPVLASDVGGLPEAKLGVDYVLPVVPAMPGSAVLPDQDTRPWASALNGLLSDADKYDRCSRRSRAAAMKFVAEVSTAAFETLFTELAASPDQGLTDHGPPS